MAGDWIKMQTSLDTNPKIFAIAEELGIDTLHAVGCMWKLWAWADTHSIDGNALTVTSVTLDRLIGVSGFAQALRNVGWLAGDDGCLNLPNFEEHNGKTAKTRASTSSRVKRHRNGESVTKALPEKRREEKNKDIKRKPSKTPLPEGFSISERVRSWAAEKGHGNLDRHLENFVSSCKRNGYTYVDWDEALMEAIRKDWAKIGQGSSVVDIRFKGAK